MKSIRHLIGAALAALSLFAAAQTTVTVPGASLTIPQDPAIPAMRSDITALQADVAALKAPPSAPPVAAIDSDDIIFGIDATKPLSQQPASFDACGSNTSIGVASTSIMCSGSARISIVADPLASSRKVIRIAQDSSDPEIGGQPRAEMNMWSNPQKVPTEVWFWRAFQWYAPSWPSNDDTVLIAQFHNSGGTCSNCVNPPGSFKISGGQFRLDVRYSDSSGQVNPSAGANVALGPVITGRWVTVVQRIKFSPQGSGGQDTYIDGKLVHRYVGRYGYIGGAPYAKQGLYPLGNANDHTTFVRGPWFVRDSGYTAADLAEWVATK